MRGSGVDCVRFANSVLDELHGYDGEPVPIIHAQAAIHGHPDWAQVVRALAARYPHRRERDGSIGPGCLIVTRTVGRLAHHVLIAGWEAYTAWEVNPGSVVRRTGVGGLPIRGVYRPTSLGPILEGGV